MIAKSRVRSHEITHLQEQKEKTKFEEYSRFFAYVFVQDTKIVQTFYGGDQSGQRKLKWRGHCDVEPMAWTLFELCDISLIDTSELCDFQTTTMVYQHKKNNPQLM